MKKEINHRWLQEKPCWNRVPVSVLCVWNGRIAYHLGVKHVVLLTDADTHYHLTTNANQR